MEKLDRLGQLMGALRRRVLDAARGERGPTASAAAGAQPSAAPGGIEALRERIHQRIRALPRDDGARDARAARIFVESVLVWEFGEALLDDPEFARLVDRVDERIAADEGLRSRLRGLLEELAG